MTKIKLHESKEIRSLWNDEKNLKTSRHRKNADALSKQTGDVLQEPPKHEGGNEHAGD
ncbi:MAG: hypothetical protein GX568_08345 [Candidatus Gastranaerophilales bacterium]|nr:hypothetical protein [Candidatus Gastranaerophilales bacterium]